MTADTDRDAAPTAAEGAASLVAMRIKLPDVLARASVNGAEEYVKTAMQGMWPTERERWGHALQCLEATIALAREALLARAAAPRKGEHRPCDLPQCDHRCNACGRLWPCEAVEDIKLWGALDAAQREHPGFGNPRFASGFIKGWAAAREAARGEG